MATDEFNDEFEDFLFELHINRDAYSRAKIIELIKEEYQKSIKPKLPKSD